MQPTRFRYGHTSPLYIRVGGRDVQVPRAIDEGHRMLDAFERFARATAAEQYRASVLDALREARDRLNRLVD